MRVLSLFSGCGGMDLGFEGNFSCLPCFINKKLHPEWISKKSKNNIVLSKTDFNIVFANDILETAKRSWTTYFGTKIENANDMYHLNSIVNLVKDARKGIDVFPDDIDVVTGGFPCQDFSIAGKRLGFDSRKSHDGTLLDIDEPSVESRGQLYMWMREVISICKPKLFVAENVKGLSNMSDVQQIIESDFSQAAGGYLVVPARVLNTANYGVPQARERIIFFGFKKSSLTSAALDALRLENIPEKYDPYPQPTHNFADPNNEELSSFVTTSKALKGLLEPEDSTDPAQQKYSKAKYMGKHCQGQAEIKLNSVAPTIRAEHHGNIEYRRLSAEHGGKHKQELKNGLNERRLSVRECARIQTFPDDYQFIIPKENGTKGVSASDAYKLIGNAVPPIFAFNIAMNLQSKWSLYFGNEVKP